MTDQQLPTDSAERKAVPLAEGLLYYFPAALADVARVSKAGNDKHNPGQPMHHARGKSNDHADCIMRHLIDAGTIDPDDGMRHSAKVAWRALALLQEELEAAGAPLARNAKLPDVPALPIPVTIAEAVQDVKEIIGVGLTSSDEDEEEEAVPVLDEDAVVRRLRTCVNAADAARLEKDIRIAAALVVNGDTTYASARNSIRLAAARKSRVG